VNPHTQILGSSRLSSQLGMLLWWHVGTAWLGPAKRMIVSRDKFYGWRFGRVTL